MSMVDDCLAANRRWAARRRAEDPGYFARLCAQQRPELLWIGCADSRLMPTELMERQPGEVFIHRNVANLARPGDPSFEAVLAFAVESLGVKDVVVCGHYGCGGVKAALDGLAEGEVGEWLAPVRGLVRARDAELAALADRERREDRLCELNVLAQVESVRASEILRRTGHAVRVHGWIYSLRDGLLRALSSGGASPELQVREASALGHAEAGDAPL